MDEDVSRQQRRHVERAREREWQRSARKRERWQGTYLQADDLLPYFIDVQTADVVRDAVENCLVHSLAWTPIPEKGYAIGVRVAHLFGERCGAFAPAGVRQCHPEQNSHIAVTGFFDSSDCEVEELRTGLAHSPTSAIGTFIDSARSELRLPFAIVRDNDLVKRPFGNCWLYQIRFNTERAADEGKVCEETFTKLGRGYFGVTRRPFALRMTEHFEDMKSGGGHLLHAVWRDLETRGIPHRVIAQLVTHSTDEDDVYEAEERAVAQYSLAPLGLNMIPGGRSGVRFLRSLGLHNAGFDNRDRLLEVAVNGREPSKPHYRSAHLREYKSGSFTMVSGHWVNAIQLQAGNS